ncbi:MAG: hypothetical protein RLZ35_1217 [Pseudomonadota bacterium]|jgi:hypothetical protein
MMNNEEIELLLTASADAPYFFEQEGVELGSGATKSVDMRLLVMKSQCHFPGIDRLFRLFEITLPNLSENKQAITLHRMQTLLNPLEQSTLDQSKLKEYSEQVEQKLTELFKSLFDDSKTFVDVFSSFLAQYPHQSFSEQSLSDFLLQKYEWLQDSRRTAHVMTTIQDMVFQIENNHNDLTPV